MPHIHTEPGQHDTTVTEYIIRDDGNEPRGLLHMHRKQHILLPVGGHVELDETPWAAMAHELEEESGYTLDQLDVLQPRLRIDHNKFGRAVHPQPVVMNTHHIADNHWHSDTAYLFVAHHEAMSQPAEGESQDIRWLTADEIAALSDQEIKPLTREVFLMAFAYHMSEWEPVTASSFSIDKVAD